MRKRFARLAATSAAVAGIAVSTLLGSASSSAAAGGTLPDTQLQTVSFELCASGNYSAQLHFVGTLDGNTGVNDSPVVKSGQSCWYGERTVNGRIKVQVKGFWLSGSGSFVVNGGQLPFYSGQKTLSVHTQGTTANSGAGAYYWYSVGY
ncbi:hypothetical protein ACIP98_41835 [Streptomyces sp. NPDC088354]|uniref:hypothetical protein n=1 Tax=Streptomyces sp. NPDC088354 TaxID=3365856 RepID=UPI00380CF49A